VPGIAGRERRIIRGCSNGLSERRSTGSCAGTGSRQQRQRAVAASRRVGAGAQRQQRSRWKRRSARGVRPDRRVRVNPTMSLSSKQADVAFSSRAYHFSEYDAAPPYRWLGKPLQSARLLHEHNETHGLERHSHLAAPKSSSGDLGSDTETSSRALTSRSLRPTDWRSRSRTATSNCRSLRRGDARNGARRGGRGGGAGTVELALQPLV